MDARTVAQKLLFLSQNPKNQPSFCKEGGVLQGLTSSLLHTDNEVAIMSARTLQFLSSHPQNKKPMKDFPKLVDNLLYCSQCDLKMKKFCIETLENIGVSCSNNQQQNTNTREILQQPLNQIDLFVEGLHDMETCISIQRTLVKIPGVVSVSFDKLNGVVAVSTRSAADLSEKLCDTLKVKLGVPCRLGYQESDSGYLDEEDFKEEVENTPSTQTISRYGGGPESCLEARLREEQRTQDEVNRTERILTKVGSAMSSAGNWLLGW